MKINKKRAGLAAGALAGVTMLIAPAAFAANVLVVDGLSSTGNVVVDGVNKGTLSFETDYLEPASCTTSDVDGYVKRGVTVASGVKIGAITNLTFGSASALCSATTLNYPVIIEKDVNTGAPAEWDIVATATPTKGQAEVPIEIRNIWVKMHSTTTNSWPCSITARGTVAGKFNQSTQRISIDTAPSYPLAITALGTAVGSKTPAVSGVSCGTLVQTGDFASMDGEFTLTTPGVGGIHF